MEGLVPWIAAVRGEIRRRLGTTDDPLGADQATSLAYVDLAIELEALAALIAASVVSPELAPSARIFAEKVIPAATSLVGLVAPATPASTTAEMRAILTRRMEATS